MCCGVYLKDHGARLMKACIRSLILIIQLIIIPTTTVISTMIILTTIQQQQQRPSLPLPPPFRRSSPVRARIRPVPTTRCRPIPQITANYSWLCRFGLTHWQSGLNPVDYLPRRAGFDLLLGTEALEGNRLHNRRSSEGAITYVNGS